MAEKATIGDILRQHREERGLTAEQAAFRSKVPIRLLQALETDDYRLLPDASYLVRFLHEYARLLNLDPEPLEREFRKTMRRPAVPSLSPGPPPPRPAIPWKHIVWTGVAILAVTPLVFIVLSLASKRSVERPMVPRPVADRPPVEQAPVGGEGRDLPDRLQAVPSGGEGREVGPTLAERTATGPEASRAPEPSSPVPILPTPSPERKPPRFVLTALALETTWMAVRADGGQGREVLLQKGQTAQFAADTGFLVTLGNAGGVELRLNGESVPPLGASGQVVRDLAIPAIRRPPDGPGVSFPEAILTLPGR